MAQVLIGLKPPVNGNIPATGELTGGMTRATLMGQFSTWVWIERIGARMGKNGSATAWMQPAVWSGGSAPGPLVGKAKMQAVTTYWPSLGGSSGGSNHEADVEGGPVLVAPWTNLYGGIFGDANDGTFGQNWTPGATMWQRGTPGSPVRPIPDPFNHSSANTQAKMHVWAVGTPNSTPRPPKPVSPGSGGVTSDPIPTITVAFDDADIGRGDYATKHQIDLYDRVTGTLVDGSGVVTASGLQASWAPDDPLPAGEYTVRAYMWDRAGAKSAAGSWHFTVNAGGSVVDLTLAPAVGTTPDGAAVYNDTDPDWVSAGWTHGDGESTDQWEWRIVNADTKAEVRETVGGPFEVAPGDMLWPNYVPEWSALPPGPTRYIWQVRARDALGSWSEWADSPPFVINAAPTITSATPAAGYTTAQRPLLEVEVSDPTDTPASLNVTFTVEGVEHPGAYRAPNRYTYQVTASDVPGYAAIDWSAEASDQWGLSSAAMATRTVNYVAPPDVTVTSPGAVEPTAHPTITATVDRPITGYRATIRDTATGATHFTSGDVQATGQAISHAVDEASGDGNLRNATDYELELTVDTSDGLRAIAYVPFRVEYPAPAPPADAAATTVAASIYDAETPWYPAQYPNVTLSWTRVDESDVPDADWQRYVVLRDDGDGYGRRWTLENRDQTELVDTSPPSGHPVTYYLTFERYVNDRLDTIQSKAARFDMTVTLRHVTITSEEADGPAVALPFWRNRRDTLNIDTGAMQGIGRRAPYGFQAPTEYEGARGSFRPLDHPDGLYSATGQAETIKTLAKPTEDENGRIGPRRLWFRDPEGRAFRFMFRKGPETEPQHNGTWNEVDVEGHEIDGGDRVPVVAPEDVV